MISTDKFILCMLEVCIIVIFIYIYGLQSMGPHKLTCFSRRRLTASMYNTITLLNKILFAYESLLLIDCASHGLLLAMAHCNRETVYAQQWNNRVRTDIKMRFSRTCKDQIPGFSRTQNAFSRTFQDTLCSQTWLHEAKKCTYQISFRCSCITVKKPKCGDKMHTMYYNEFLLDT